MATTDKNKTSRQAPPPHVRHPVAAHHVALRQKLHVYAPVPAVVDIHLTSYAHMAGERNKARGKARGGGGQGGARTLRDQDENPAVDYCTVLYALLVPKQ